MIDALALKSCKNFKHLVTTSEKKLPSLPSIAVPFSSPLAVLGGGYDQSQQQVYQQQPQQQWY